MLLKGALYHYLREENKDADKRWLAEQNITNVSIPPKLAEIRDKISKNKYYARNKTFDRMPLSIGNF